MVSSTVTVIICSSRLFTMKHYSKTNTHFQPIARDKDGKLSFHSVQDATNEFRTSRIRNLRKAFPPLQQKKCPTHVNAPIWLESTTGSHLNMSSPPEYDHPNSNITALQSNFSKKVDGLSNAEIFEKVGRELSHHAK
jgi:hypothetical protein